MTTEALLSALESATCGAYAVSVDQKIVFWNHSAERILGYSAAEVMGKRCYDVVAGLSPGGLAPECLGGCPSMRYLRAGLVPAPIKLRLLCASGERKWVTVSPMVVAGVYRDAPLLVHLFEEAVEAEETSGESLREGLAASGTAIFADRPQVTSVSPERPILSRREMEVLRLMAQGWDTQRIATELGISRHTVRNHIRNLRQRLNASTKLDAVVKGIRLGILHMS
ncbi:MAG: LuxR C-terminal-related transcriptional regulator [Chloroflexi bacterium]|nr:LuxR C-terminal-related transcriptional regulator [Chloroflexota bacterium]